MKKPFTNTYFSLLLLLFVLSLGCSSDAKDGSSVPNEEPRGEEPMDGGDEMPSSVDDGVMRDLTSSALVAQMKAGWNLGNSLDAEGPNETVWGNPATTQAMIDAVASRGFSTLRVPVTWRFHQGSAPNYLVETSWLDRVEEVVNYGRANNMYVIINVHHDDPWIIPTEEAGDEVKNRLEKLWTQIANRFKNYSDYVIFETLNEPRYEGSPEEWSGGTAEGRAMVNAYHQVSLDAIRATGGNNATRKVMISPYAASTVHVALEDFMIPNNDPNTMVSIHTYFPFPFTLEGTDSTWGTDEDKMQLDMEMDRIKTKFIDNGIAVVLGEWSSGNQNNLEDRQAHAQYYAQAAAQRGFAAIWWDNGITDASNDALGIFDRRTLNWPFGSIADLIVNAYN